LSLPERAQAVRVLLRWGVRIRHGLATELVDAGKSFMSRFKSGRKPGEFNEAKKEQK
jgi:hypothetical protein